MNKKIRPLSIAISACFIATAAPVNAQSSIDMPISNAIEENAEERINFSGKLRMLSQRIPSAACHLNRGIAVENARSLLEEATAEFAQILAALEFGDEDLNIVHPETRRKSLARIHELRVLWEPFQTAADAVIAETADESQLDHLLMENLAVLGAAQLVVEELSKQYANPNAATRATLMLIDISGRQRMLTQKISKEACFIGGRHQSEDTINDLQGTVQVFEASMEALRFGMPSVGIGPPPNPYIVDGLDVVSQDWTNVKPMIETIIDTGELDAASHAVKFDQLNVTMSHMNSVVGLYASAAQPNS